MRNKARTNGVLSKRQLTFHKSLQHHVNSMKELALKLLSKISELSPNMVKGFNQDKNTNRSSEKVDN